MKNIYILVCLFILSTGLFAQTIAVQGVLRDPKGRTVEDESYSVTFKLYDSAAGGTALYVETHPSITTSQGLFATKLGLINSLYQIPFDTTYYLGIAVEDTDELEPRTELTLSPYTASSVGRDNQFHSTGDVTIKDSLHIDLGNLYLKEGNVMLDKGDILLDEGTITINLGDIYISGASGAVRFSDGTILNSAGGGTASSASNTDTLNILADADYDSAGGIEFQIGIEPALLMANDGMLEVLNGLQFDSSKLIYVGNREIQFGHYNPTDSSFISSLDLGYDSIARFQQIPQSIDSASEDNELITLKEVVKARDGSTTGVTEVNGENIYDLSNPNAFVTGGLLNDRKATFEYANDQPSIGEVLGSGNDQGTVFHMNADYVYVAKFVDEDYRLAYIESGSWNASDDFGAGYLNTLKLFEVSSTFSGDDVSEYWEYQIKTNHPKWYLPSVNEMDTLTSNSSQFTSNDYRWLSSRDNCSSNQGTAYYTSSSCEHYRNQYPAVLIRRIERERKTIIGDNNDFATYEMFEDKFASLELKLAQVEESIAIDPFTENQIGTFLAGGTVFAIEGGFAYIAYFLDNNVYLSEEDNGWSNDTVFGTGEQNTLNLYNADPTTSSSYTIGLLQSPINGYSDWWVPSQDELLRIFQNTNLGYRSGGYYYWTSSQSGCSSSEAIVIDGNENSFCRSIDTHQYTALIVRKTPVN